MQENSKTPSQVIPENMESLTRLTHLMYALQAIAFIFGVAYLLAIVSLIIAYIKYPDVKDSWLETHFRWQIDTFWYGLLWLVVGCILVFALVGWVVLAINYIWLIYRVIKGWLALYEQKSVFPYVRKKAA